MWNPFSKKKNKEEEKESSKTAKASPMSDAMFENMDLSDEALEQALSQHQGKLGFMEKMALKKFKKMSPEQRKEVLSKMMSPEKMEENREKMIEQMEEMRASGQLNSKQYKIAKKRLGIKD